MSSLPIRSALISQSANLNEPHLVGTHNDGNEYVRGQAELIAYATLTGIEGAVDMIQSGDLLDRIYAAIKNPSPENIAKACEQPILD